MLTMEFVRLIAQKAYSIMLSQVNVNHVERGVKNVINLINKESARISLNVQDVLMASKCHIMVTNA
jgi:hypothetical protein